MKQFYLLSSILLLSWCPPALACMWDYDTLHEERSRFPSVLELIVGYYPQHSDELYEWRIGDRERKLAGLDPADAATLPLRDDMAVAHDELGRPEAAIALMQRSLEIAPDRYETHANLGTFYIHNGEYERGLEHIERAIEINPDAHFGREVVQRRLVEYLLSRRDEDGEVRLPLRWDHEAPPVGDGEASVDPILTNEPVRDPFDTHSAIWEGGGFRGYLRELKRSKTGGGAGGLTHEEAIRGVSGMLRFGRPGSPILLEALGDLLADDNTVNSSQRLAAKAYFMASYAVDDPVAAERYRRLAAAALTRQSQYVSDASYTDAVEGQIEPELSDEVAAAEAYVAGIHADERRWIAAGEDVEAMFDAKFRDAATVLPSSWGWEDLKPDPIQRAILVVVAAVVVVLLVLASAVYFAVRWLLQRRRNPPPLAASSGG